MPSQARVTSTKASLCRRSSKTERRLCWWLFHRRQYCCGWPRPPPPSGPATPPGAEDTDAERGGSAAAVTDGDDEDSNDVIFCEGGSGLVRRRHRGGQADGDEAAVLRAAEREAMGRRRRYRRTQGVKAPTCNEGEVRISSRAGSAVPRGSSESTGSRKESFATDRKWRRHERMMENGWGSPRRPVDERRTPHMLAHSLTLTAPTHVALAHDTLLAQGTCSATVNEGTHTAGRTDRRTDAWIGRQLASLH